MMVGGVMMIIVGITISWYLTETTPIGKAGMTEEEKINLLLAERENSDYRTLSGILIGIGFLLILIRFTEYISYSHNPKEHWVLNCLLVGIADHCFRHSATKFLI